MASVAANFICGPLTGPSPSRKVFNGGFAQVARPCNQNNQTRYVNYQSTRTKQKLKNTLCSYIQPNTSSTCSNNVTRWHQMENLNSHGICEPIVMQAMWEIMTLRRVYVVLIKIVVIVWWLWSQESLHYLSQKKITKRFRGML